MRSPGVALRAFGSRIKRRAVSARRRVINLAAKRRAKGRNPQVSTAVSPDETMLNVDGTLRLYFEIGADALEQIRVGLAAAGLAEPRRILDLPCGHGRVLRYMRAAWPDAEIVAMELLAGAPEFCAATFGARPVRSANPLWTVDTVGTGFDLVWSGSLLTHFDSDAWIPTLSFFRDRLRSGGALIFTTHGERSIRLLARDPSTVELVRVAIEGWDGDYLVGDAAPGMVERVRCEGFAFEDYGWVSDAKWGVSVSTEDWVRRTVEEVGGLTLVRFEPQGWFEHQDVWTFTRSG